MNIFQLQDQKLYVVGSRVNIIIYLHSVCLIKLQLFYTHHCPSQSSQTVFDLA